MRAGWRERKQTTVYERVRFLAKVVLYFRLFCVLRVVFNVVIEYSVMYKVPRTSKINATSKLYEIPDVNF